MSVRNEIVMFDYYGLKLCLLNSDPLPLHIYGIFENRRMFAEIQFLHGIFKGSRCHQIDGFLPLNEDEKELFLRLLEANLPGIIKNWQDHFIYGLPVISEVINKKI